MGGMGLDRTIVDIRGKLGGEMVGRLCGRVLESGEGISVEDALGLAASPAEDLMWVLAGADAIRRKLVGNRVRLCSIVNAKSGLCGEDCAFCAQSKVSKADIETYRLRDSDWLCSRAEEAARNGAGEFSIVTSGKKVSGAELARIRGVVARVRTLGMESCASLGVLDEGEIDQLKEAGLQVFHHNLETSRSFYPNIVSTRSFDDNVTTVRHVKRAGLQVCCGGIFGLGESWEQRIELFSQLRELDVDRVPINFLIPIEGTPLGDSPLLHPLEALKIIAIARWMLPGKHINVAGGRERVLGQFQSMVFFAGASGILIGNYLTTKGRGVEEDWELVRAIST